MKEIAFYILPIILVFSLIGIIESAMLFEEAQEEVSALYSKNTRKDDCYGNIESRELM